MTGLAEAKDEAMLLSDRQLDAYLARIGVLRPLQVDFATLAEIHRAHLLSFTWEALDAFMGWPSSICPRDAYVKMVEGRRGGWCYEMNGLLGAALAALGFRLTRLCGAVLREELGGQANGNHLTLRIDLEQAYLAEVGLGDALIAPVPMRAGDIRQRGFAYSISATEDGWLRFRNQSLGLAPSFDFQPDRSDEDAFVTAHRWLTTDVMSPFTRTLALFRHTSDGYVALQNDRLRRITAETIVEQKIASASEFGAVLTEIFQIEIPRPSEVWEKILACQAQNNPD